MATRLQTMNSSLQRQIQPQEIHCELRGSSTFGWGDSTTLAKSLIMAVEDVAHDWYMSLKPLSIGTLMSLCL
jgi:hypothetical protein